jgi:hypothetical protein
MLRSSFFILCQTALVSLLYAQDATLYVFYPSVIRPQILQKKISDDLPGVAVTVFGRYVDFAEQVKKSPPDAMLTKPDVIAQFNEFGIMLAGYKNGSSEEPYFLVSTQKEPLPEDIALMNVGTLDFLGRSGMDSLMQRIFPSPPKLKRVTKIEDLLPLLTFGMAEAVFVSERHADYLKKSSNMHFIRKVVPHGEIGIVSLAARKNAPAKKIAFLIRKNPLETSSMFDVEGWK